MHTVLDALSMDSSVTTGRALPHLTNLQPSKLSRSDVSFPLSTPRRRTPSMASMTDCLEHDAHQLGRLAIRASTAHPPQAEDDDVDMHDRSPQETTPALQTDALSIFSLPPEVQNRILDHIFGDMASVHHMHNSSSRTSSINSLMRHPRRKAVSDFALITPLWRDLVQERIYRHIKIKGTRPSISESREWFTEHSHLTRHVRHIEFWIPVWGDRPCPPTVSYNNDEPSIPPRRDPVPSNTFRPRGQNEAIDIPGITYPLSIQSATLSEIFSHISIHFPNVHILTLEGGHCKKSNMIRHFSPSHLFTPRQFEILPSVSTLAMRGAWNLMRSHADWCNIERALPNLEEWQCSFAKPRREAEQVVNDILQRGTRNWRRVNVSLDGMYSKDSGTLGSSSSSGTDSASERETHLCKNLGSSFPYLESFSYTGKVCESVWEAAKRRIIERRIESRLQRLELVVKSCCRQRVETLDAVTGEVTVEELGGVMADGAGITNLVFIRAFERLVLHTVNSLRYFPHLHYIRIRFIDLDSPCTLLNPYWLMENGAVYGIWSEEIVERLAEVRPEVQYEELGDGIETSSGVETETVGNSHHNDDRTTPTTSNTSSMYPRFRPKSIKTSSYKVLAESRA